MKPDAPLRELLSRLRSAISGDLYVVGGAVRDLLRGAPPADLDLLVADAQAAAEAVAQALEGHAFPLDLERGQLRVTLPEGSAVTVIDISALKGSLDDDLRQRDYTVDAMAVSIDDNGALGGLIDPLGGREDLKARRLRVTSEAALVADPLRMLRGVRLAVELSFDLEPQTIDSIKQHATLINQSAAERQRDELVRILATPRAATGVRLLDELGLLAELIPELMPAHGVDQPISHHYYDVFDHSVEALAALDALLAPNSAERRDFRPRIFRRGFTWFPLDDYFEETVGGERRYVLLKLAGLLHDVSKPETKTVEPSGKVRFLGHPELGSRKAEAICRRLRFGARESKLVAQLVDEHLRPTMLAPAHEVPSTHALYRFFRDLGDAAAACLVLTLADGAAATGPRLREHQWQNMVDYYAWVLQAGTQQAEALAANRLVTGTDLMAALDLEPGRLIGRLLAALEEAAAGHRVSTRDEAIDYARHLIETWQAETAVPPNILATRAQITESSPPSPSPSTERGTEGVRL